MEYSLLSNSHSVFTGCKLRLWAASCQREAHFNCMLQTIVAFYLHVVHINFFLPVGLPGVMISLLQPKISGSENNLR